MVVVSVEENEVAREVGVHELEGEGRRQGCEECPPHHLVGEVVGYLGERGITCVLNGVPLICLTCTVTIHTCTCTYM